MKMSYTDTTFCSIEFEAENPSERKVFRDIYLKLINTSTNERIQILSKMLKE